MASTRLSPVEKIGYGLGDFGSNVVFQSLIYLLPVFYTDVFGLAPAVMGWMFLAVRLLDTVTDPIMGVIAEKTSTRWGKFRPYLLWFCIPFAALFVLTYYTPEYKSDTPLFNFLGNEAWAVTPKLFYAYCTYSLLMILYTVVNIPYCALGGVITADSQERVSANSYRFFIATSAGVLITFLGPTLIDYLGDGNKQVGYPRAMGIFAVLAVLAFIACFALTKERVVQAHTQEGSFKKDLNSMLQNEQWLIVALLGLVSLIAIVVRGGTGYTYANWILKNNQLTMDFSFYKIVFNNSEQYLTYLTSSFLTAATVAAMIGAAFASTVTAKLDKAPSYALAQVIIVACSVGLFFVPPQNLLLVFGLWILINFFTQMAAPILFAMAADTADYGELKTGRRVTGLIFSGFLFAIKLGVALGGFAIGFILAAYGYDGTASTQSDTALYGVLLAISLLPAFGHFLLIPIVFCYRLSTQRCNEIRQQLDALSA